MLKTRLFGLGILLALATQTHAASQVEYFDGGIGDQGVAEAKAAANDYSLQILFSGPGGEYVAVDTLEIKQGSTPILSLDQAGPYVLVKLPPGQYTVQATYGQTEQVKNIRVDEQSPSKLNWSWPKGENSF